MWSYIVAYMKSIMWKCVVDGNMQVKTMNTSHGFLSSLDTAVLLPWSNSVSDSLLFIEPNLKKTYLGIQGLLWCDSGWPFWLHSVLLLPIPTREHCKLLSTSEPPRPLRTLLLLPRAPSSLLPFLRFVYSKAAAFTRGSLWFDLMVSKLLFLTPMICSL